MKSYEVNFDALVGPTHNYAGLSYGNVASMGSGGEVSHPKEAALQGLKKMKLLADLGARQGILPPQRRPSLALLRAFGFQGSDERVLLEAAREAPPLFASSISASSMWAANAATVTPSSDTHDRKVHFTISNLLNRFHRSIEPAETYATFRKIFADDHYFVVHSPLHKGGRMGDEGAANHTRFCKEQEGKGIHLFVYSCKAFEEGSHGTFPHRQSLEASQAIARRHGIPNEQLVFAEQSPEAIEAGVFHNDVIAVGHENLFFLHERAYVNTPKVLEEIDAKLYALTGAALIPHIIREDDLPLKQAVLTYLFNSQVVNRNLLVAPLEAQYLPLYLPFEEIHYINLRESMKNGGGPACLRLRVVLSEEEIAAVSPGYLLTDALYERLGNWIEMHYREDLAPDELSDPSLLKESHQALDALDEILHIKL